MPLTRVGAAALTVVLAAGLPAVAQNNWVTVKGQITVAEAKTPAPNVPNVAGNIDKAHCTEKGPLVDESVIVNPKNRGLKNVWVYLKPDTGDTFAAAQIHPTLVKAKPTEHVIDQPCCQFVPRILATREGDTLVVKNSSPVAHNSKIDGDPNPSVNPIIAAKTDYKYPQPLQFQKSPISIACSIHPWMGGRIMVFDHPYFALTDGDGKFEIKMAPAGKLRIFYRHENGYHMGKGGAKGFPVTLAGETMEMKPLEYEFPKQ